MRSEGRIFQRRSRWWIAYYAPKDGRSVEHRESAGDTEAEARRLLRQRLQSKAIHRAGIRPFQGPEQERVTVDELLKTIERDYEIRDRKSFPQLRSHLHHVRVFFGSDRAVSVNANRGRDYIKMRQHEGAKPATINHELKALHRAMVMAAEVGTLAAAPRLPFLPEHNARQGFFERHEFESVMVSLDEDLRDFCSWFYWTGMRPGEIRSLVWEGFDRETWTLRLHARNAKTGYGRVIALEGELRAIIERRLSARRLGCSLIFHRNGQPVGDFRKAWANACEAAKVKGRLLYDLRRTAIRNMVRAGVPERVTMEISGHRTRAVFDRYNITSERDIREAVLKTSSYVESLPTQPPNQKARS